MAGIGDPKAVRLTSSPSRTEQSDPVDPVATSLDTSASTDGIPTVFGPVAAHVAASGGTVQRLTIQAPKAPVTPRVDISGVRTAVARGASSIVESAGHAMTTIDTTTRRGANNLLDGRDALDAVSPTGTHAAELAAAGGRALISKTPSGVGRSVNSGVRGINQTIGALIPSDANFQRTVKSAIFYDDRQGTRILIQPGAQLIGDNGTIRLVGNGGFITSNGVTVSAGHSEINLGKSGQSFILDRFHVQNGSTNVDIAGAQTVLGADGSLVARAETISVDLPRQRVRISGAEIASPDANTLTAGFDQLSVRTSGVNVDAGRTALTATSNGPLSTVAATTNGLSVQSGGTQFSADTMTLSLSRNSTTNAGALRWTAEGLHFDDGKNRFDATAAAVGLTRSADGSSVFGIRAKDVDATLGDQHWTTQGQTTLQLAYDQRGLLTDVSADANSVTFTDPSTQFSATGTHLNAHLNDQGIIDSVDGGTKRLDLAMGGTQLTVDRGTVHLARDGDALVAHVTAESGRYSDSNGTYELARNGTFDARITGDAVTLAGSASAFTYANKQSTIAIQGGRVEAAFGSGVEQEFVRFNGDHLTYTGTNGGNQLSQLSVDNAVANLTRDQSGAMNLGLAGKNVAMTLDGHNITMSDVRSVDIATDAQGKLTTIDAALPGISTFTSSNGDVNVGIRGLEGHYDAVSERLRIGFEQGNVTVTSLGLTGNGSDVSLDATANAIKLQVGQGSLSRTGNNPFSLSVNDAQVGVRLGDDGRIRGLSAAIGSGTGTFQGYNVSISDLPGSQVVLSARADANGVFKEAHLVIPDGGQVLMSSNDGELRLGHQDTRLYQDNGVWRLDSRDFDVSGVWKGVAVTAKGERFDVSLSGDQLRLNHISGTDISVRKGDLNVNINIKQLDDLLANVTTISGLATGAMVTLEPASDNSRITATVSTVAAGIPIKLEINDARAFEALALVQPNQARISVGDPTGQGHVAIAAGPLRIEGQGVVGAVATYHPFSVQRMAFDAYRMGAGYQVTPNLRVSLDGAFTWHTAPSQTPVRAGLTFLAPLDAPSSWQQPNQPGYQFNPVPSQAPGFIAQLGLQRDVARDGKTKTQALGVYGGLTGSSYGSVDIQGNASIAGIPLPNHMDIPLTPQVGVFFENGEWRGHVGGHGTLGAINTPYIRDPHTVGVDAALNYESGNFSAGIAATVDPRRGRDLATGAQSKGGTDWGVHVGARWAF